MDYQALEHWLERKLNRKIFFIVSFIIWGCLLSSFLGLGVALVLMLPLSYWLGDISRRLYGRYVVKNAKDKDFWRFFCGILISISILITINFLLGYVVALIVGGSLQARLLKKSAIQNVGGGELTPFEKVKKKYEKLRPEEDPGFHWGGIQIPSREAMMYFLVVGSVGSGKTITLRLLMQTMLPTIKLGSGRRALIYDAKRDLVSLIAGMDIKCETLILNPFDERCVAWDMAKDISSYEEIASLANILVPQDEKEEAFFRDATIEILKAVVEIFVEYSPGQWTLRDIYLAMRSRKILETLFTNDPDHEDCLEFLADERTASSVMSTIKTKLGRYKTIAALWDQAEHKISLTEWAESSSILIMGKDNIADVSLNALNQLIFTRASQILLNKPEKKEPSTFIIIDELPSLGKLEKLKALTTEGRSKGVCLAFGFQSIKDIEHIYKEGPAKAITGQFRNKAILRLDDSDTAEWASKLVGESEQLLLQRNQSTNIQMLSAGMSQGVGEQYRRASAVMASEFQKISPINPSTGQGLTGYYFCQMNYKHYYPWSTLQEKLMSADQSVQDFIPVSTKSQRLQSWNKTDIERLGFSRAMLRPLEITEVNDLIDSKDLPILEPGELEEMGLDNFDLDAMISEEN